MKMFRKIEIDASFVGNPHLGVFKHKEKFYVFSSKEAALKFASRSGDFIARVAEQAKRAPELVRLLKLHQQDACTGPYSEVCIHREAVGGNMLNSDIMMLVFIRLECGTRDCAEGIQNLSFSF